MHLKFLILFVFAAFVAAQNTDAQKLISDLQGLNNAGNDLQTAIENADPNNVGDDLSLQGKFDDAKEMVQETTNDALNFQGTIDDGNAETVVGLLESLVGILVAAFKDLADKASQYPGWTDSFICGDLTSLNSTTGPLMGAFIDRCPAQYKDTAAQLQGEVQASFADVIRAYC